MATLRNPNRPRPPPAAAPNPPTQDTGGPRADPEEPVETPDKWWRESSFYLRHVLEVREEDTIPGQLLDELFTPKSRPKPKG